MSSKYQTELTSRTVCALARRRVSCVLGYVDCHCALDCVEAYPCISIPCPVRRARHACIIRWTGRACGGWVRVQCVPCVPCACGGHGATKTVGPIAISPNHDVPCSPFCHITGPRSETKNPKHHVVVRDADERAGSARDRGRHLRNPLRPAGQPPAARALGQAAAGGREGRRRRHQRCGLRQTSHRDQGPKGEIGREHCEFGLALLHSSLPTTRLDDTKERTLTMTQSVMSAPAADLAPPKVSRPLPRLLL